MSQDYDYITLYMPYNGLTQRYEHSSLLSQDCYDWLELNVGKGTTSIQAWMLAHDTDEFQWAYLGVQHSPESDFTALSRKFLIKDGHKALMFKLVWGG